MSENIVILTSISTPVQLTTCNVVYILDDPCLSLTQDYSDQSLRLDAPYPRP